MFKQVPITGFDIDIQKAPECEAVLEHKDFDILYIFEFPEMVRTGNAGSYEIKFAPKDRFKKYNKASFI